MDHELNIHILAYRNLFRAVLNKRNLSDAEKQTILSDLDAYLKKTITKTDDFIDHISEYAKKLNVNPGALGGFIGANFMKALQGARVEWEQTQASPSDAGGKRSYATFMDEVLYYTAHEMMGRFEDLDLGLLKIVYPDGSEVFPGSMENPIFSQVVSMPEGAVIAGGSPGSLADNKETAQATTGKSEEKTKKTSGWVPPHDSPLIMDILEKLGSVLDITEKLEPRAFPPEMEGVMTVEISGPGDAESTGPDNSEAASRPASATKPAKPTPAWLLNDRPIIKEILENYGNILNITEKLEVSSGIESQDQGIEFISNDSQASQEPEVVERDFIPIEMTFADFLSLLKTVQVFQQKKDGAGYKRWLSHEASRGQRVILMLKNLDIRLKSGSVSSVDAEIANIATKTDFVEGQIKDLHRRLKVFERLQMIIQRLTEDVKRQDQSLFQVIHKIWGQVRMLFTEPGDASSLTSRLKIILLQIPDESQRERVLGIIQPYLEKAGEAYGLLVRN